MTTKQNPISIPLGSFWVTKRYPVTQKDGSKRMFNFIIGTTQKNMLMALERVMNRRYSSFKVKHESNEKWTCIDPTDSSLKITVEMRQDCPEVKEGEGVSIQDLRGTNEPPKPPRKKLPSQILFKLD